VKSAFEFGTSQEPSLVSDNDETKTTRGLYSVRKRQSRAEEKPEAMIHALSSPTLIALYSLCPYTCFPLIVWMRSMHSSIFYCWYPQAKTVKTGGIVSLSFLH
jgi:hypothetical protein